MTQIVKDPDPGHPVRVRAGEPIELRLRRGRQGDWRLARMPGHVIPLDAMRQGATQSVVHVLAFRDAGGDGPTEVTLEYVLDGAPRRERRVLLDVV